MLVPIPECPINKEQQNRHFESLYRLQRVLSNEESLRLSELVSCQGGNVTLCAIAFENQRTADEPLNYPVLL